MAEDRKFKYEDGHYVNRVSGEIIPDDEPIFIFRARDKHALVVLQIYEMRVKDPHHKQAISEAVKAFEDFANEFPQRMKEPGITRHMKLKGDQSND